MSSLYIECRIPKYHLNVEIPLQVPSELGVHKDDKYKDKRSIRSLHEERRSRLTDQLRRNDNCCIDSNPVRKHYQT